MAALSVLALAGCGAARVGDTACADAFRRQGRLYIATSVARPLPPAAGTVTIEQSGCNDSDGPPAPSTHRSLQKLSGIPASVALAALDGRLYVAQDSWPALSDHPLHHLLYGAPGSPAGPVRRCATRRLTGRLGLVGTGTRFVLVTIRLRLPMRLSATTRLASRVVDGVPRVRRGLRVRVTAKACSGARVPWARSVRVAR